MRNLPNILSTSRLLVTVVIFVLILVNQPWAFLVTMALFLLASVTDYFDGYLARKYKLVSSLGVFLDLTADKVLVGGALVALVQVALVPAWVAFIIITREFLVSGLRSIAAARGHVIPAGPWGKQKTFITLVALDLLFLAKGFGAHRLSLFPWMLNFGATGITVADYVLLVADALVVLATIWTAFSGIEYVVGALPIFHEESEQATKKA